MPLTEAQIAFETEWVQRWKKLSQGQDGPAWSMLYTEDATFKGTSGQVLTGRPTILKYREHLLNVFEDFVAPNFTITIDEKLSRIIVVYDGVVVLRGDPEHKRIFVRAVRVATKDLGVGAEQMRQEEYISDPSPVVMRMMELGMDPRKLAFNP